MKNTGLRITLFFLAIYFLTAQGSIQTSDGMSMYLLTQSIAEQGSLSINAERTELLSLGKDGSYFSKYGLGQSLLAIPLYLAGVAVGKITGIPKNISTTFTVSLFNPIVSSLVCLFIFLCALEMGINERIAFFLTCAYGISTTAWHYSQDFMSEPLTTLFFVIAFFYALRTASGSARNYLCCGFAIGCALVVRPASIIAIPAYLIYIYFKNRNDKKLFRNSCYFVGACVPFLCVVIFYNYIRFGSLFDAGYQSHGFTTPLWTGVIGHLATPGKSIFLYNPFLIISAIGFYAFIKAKPQEALLAGLFFIFHLLLYSKWDVWMGGMTWGSRFLLVTFPFLVLSSGYFLAGKGKVWWRVAIVLFVVGCIIQLPALVVNISRYHYTLRVQYKNEMMSQLIYTPRHSPLIGQWEEVVKVMGNVRDHEYLKNLVSQAKNQRSFIGRDNEEILAHGLALNVPNFWWFYLYLYGFPSWLTLSIPIFLMIVSLWLAGRIIKSIYYPVREDT